MADNIVLNAGSGGSTLAAASLSVSGDTAIVQMVGCGILSGSEGSWTLSQLVGGAGAVAAGVQRITLASDDPAVALLGTIDTDTGAMVTDLAAIEVLLTAANVDHAANEVLLTTIAGDTTSIDAKITACNTGAVVVSSGTITTVSTVTNLSQLGGQAIAMGEGVLGTGVQRVSLATDDDAVAHLATIAGDTTSLDGKVTACNTGAVVVSGALPAGTNAIGKLAANSGVDIGDVDVTSIAAGTNTIGGTISQQSTSVAYDGTTACTIQRASGVAASGTTAMVAAEAGKKVRILAIALFATSATVTNVYVATTTDTDVIGNAGNPIPLAVDADGDNVAGFVLPFNPGGWTETSTANEALNLVLSVAQGVIWMITYIKVA